MSEPINEAQPVEPAVEPAATVEPAEVDWKAKAREWETRSKANLAKLSELQPMADQFRALEEASKSEAQRKDEALAAASRLAETAQAEAIRYKAAATHGITADYFDLLGSGTEDEITARAERISQLVAAQVAATQVVPPGSAPTTRPVEQLRPGATPAGLNTEDDVIMARLFGAPPT